MTANDLVEMLYKALKVAQEQRNLPMFPPIKKLSFDGDHKSCELIVETEDADGRHDFVISSNAVRELDRED